MDGFAYDEITRLAGRFAAVDVGREFADFVADIVRDAACRPYLEPYVPLVGPDYRSGGLLVYATAQNLARNGAFEPGVKSMFRLWPGDEPPAGPVACPPGEVGIQPWDDGLLPALVKMWHLARGSEAVDVWRSTAVSNYFKLSLGRGHKHNLDLNPAKLGWVRAQAFARLTWEHFVRAEIEVLQPGVVLTFPGAQATVLHTELGGRCVVEEVNDPAWVKRGMSGAARGSWATAVTRAAERLAPFEDAIEDALDRCKPPYSGAKRPSAHVYLSYYLSKWLPP
jgi:hypothetical protein